MTRSIFLEIWKFFIALVSLFSSLLGMYMAAFMISVGGSEFTVNNTFDFVYLTIEICQLIEITITKVAFSAAI